MIVSMILPSWNRPDDLIRSIDNIYETTKGYEVEIVVVLNFSDEKSHLAIVEKNVRLLTMPSSMPNGRPHRCWQAGYKISNGDWICQTSDDVLFDDSWLDIALNHPNKGFIALYDRSGKGMGFCTHFIATREYIESVQGGYFVPVWYYNYFSDNEIYRLAERSERYTLCAEATFVHLNRNLLKNVPDQYCEIADSHYGEDQITYIKRHSLGFPLDWKEV